MTTDTAVPIAEEVQSLPAQAGEPTDTQQPEGQDAAPEGRDAAPEDKPAEKPTKTPEQAEIDRLRRGLERKRDQVAALRAQIGLTRPAQESNNAPAADDSEPLSMSRSEFERLSNARAAELAPTLARQQADQKRIHDAAVSLRAELGADQFQEATDELASVFTNEQQLALLESDNPAALVRYLTDPEHADEAEAIAQMSSYRAGLAVAKLDLKLRTAAAAPKASNAPAPLESVRGSGPINSAPDIKDTKAWIRHQNALEAKGLL